MKNIAILTFIVAVSLVSSGDTLGVGEMFAMPTKINNGKTTPVLAGSNGSIRGSKTIRVLTGDGVHADGKALPVAVHLEYPVVAFSTYVLHLDHLS